MQIDALEARLTRDHANWLGFCHNDLQCGNVMLDASSLDALRGPAMPLDLSTFAVVGVRGCTLTWGHPFSVGHQAHLKFPWHFSMLGLCE